MPDEGAARRSYGLRHDQSHESLVVLARKRGRHRQHVPSVDSDRERRSAGTPGLIATGGVEDGRHRDPGSSSRRGERTSSARPGGQARRLRRRSRARRPDRLGDPGHRARGLRAQGRDGALRRRLAGRRLRVGAGTDADPADFDGLSSSALVVVVHSSSATTSAPEFQQTILRVERSLAADKRVASVQRPRPGASISSDGHTAVVTAGANGDATAMVAAADALKAKLKAAGTSSVAVSLTGSPGMWSDFNTANKAAMMKSELLSWPVTMAIIVLAFGSLVAAGLPLLLTILGLVASAGLLSLLTNAFDISIWAMNFALMFSLALGIDYALFIVHRFRGAFFGSRLGLRDAVAVTMDTAGKAVLFSGLTVLVSLSAVLLVPSPAFRSTALGIIISVVFVLAATLTLLPAVLAKLGPKVDALALRRVRSGEHARRIGALGRATLASRARVRSRRGARARPARPADPGSEDRHAVDQGRPRRRRLTDRLRADAARLRRRRARSAPDRRAAASGRGRGRGRPRDPGVARVLAPQFGAAALPSYRRSPRPTRRARPLGERSTGSAAHCPLAPSSAAAPPRTTTSRRRCGEDAAAHRRRAHARLPAPAPRRPGAVDRRAGRRHEPARHRRRLRDRAADLPGRPRRRPPGLRGAGLHGRVGAGVLLRDDLRDLDGLHGVPARLGQGTLGPLARPARGRGRWPRPVRARHLRRRRRDGRRLLHLRALRTAPAQGDGRDPRRLRAARRDARPARPAPGAHARSSGATPGLFRPGWTGSSPTSASGTPEHRAAQSWRKASAWAAAHCSKVRGSRPRISRTAGSIRDSSSEPST